MFENLAVGMQLSLSTDTAQRDNDRMLECHNTMNGALIRHLNVLTSRIL